MKILHVTAHLGGGIGSILSAIALHDKNNIHAILTLEETENKHFENACKNNDIEIYNISQIEKINEFDIVQIEWWHHPLVCQFMVEILNKFDIRLLVWSHISGCNYPAVPFEFVKLPARFIFASPFSYENPFWNDEERKWIKEHTNIIVSSSVKAETLDIVKSEHETFNIGYIGFLGYEKLDKDFVKYCEKFLNIENVKFIIAGDEKYSAELMNDIKNSKIKDKVEFLGYVSDVNEVLKELDLFLYSLDKNHTGTAENALIEAMFFGIPAVVKKQNSEKYTIKEFETGFFIENIDDIDKIIDLIKTNSNRLKEIGEEATRFVKENLVINKTIEGLNDVYINLMKEDKQKYSFRNVFGSNSYEWFMSCFKGDINNLSGINLKENKASIRQYEKYFPSDELKKIINNNTGGESFGRN